MNDFCLDLEYADDIIVICSPDLAQIVTSFLEMELSAVGLGLNPRNSHVMESGYDPQEDILIGGVSIPRKDTAVVLGASISNTSDQMMEVENRIQKARVCENKIGKTAL